MRKARYCALIIALLIFVAGCTKKGPAETGTHALGSWTFKGKTYNQSNCYVYNGGELIGASTSPCSTLLLSFYNTVPTTSGTYDVVHNEFANQVAIEFDDSASGNQYYSYNYSGVIQPVSITVSSTGKISVSGSNITLFNLNDRADSASFALNMVQQ